jgi:CRISPR/Cas system-associated exonuclease Cas4 (RecB family)
MLPHTKQVNDEIMCSGGKGRMSKVDCLACALKGNQPCHLDYAVLNALFHDQSRERTGIHVTDLTGCLRKAWYEKQQPVPEYPHEMMSRFVGTAVHNYVEQAPSDLYEKEVEMEGMGVVGKADILYNNGRLIDIKTTRWISVDRLPYGSHVTQLQAYAALLRAQGKKVTSAAIQYIDMTGASKHNGRCRGWLIPTEEGFVCKKCGALVENAHTGAYIFEVELDEGLTQEWIAVREQLLRMSLETKDMPEAEPGWLCDYCPFSEICIR